MSKSGILKLAVSALSPNLSKKYFQWGRMLSGVSEKRQSLVFLTSLLTLRGSSPEVKLLVSQLAVLTFEIDNEIDVVDNSLRNDLSISQKILERYNPIILEIANGDQELFVLIKNQIKILINADMIALDSKSGEEYLTNASISIGLNLLTNALACKLKLNINIEYLDICSRIVRLLSDIATFEKDALEGGNNIVNLIGMESALKMLSSLTRSFEMFRIENEVDLFLSRTVTYTKRFYKPNKDFEI